jgi:peptidoglycan/xylan/chitin deacetylase (PgdA/CDA1 family)
MVGDLVKRVFFGGNPLARAFIDNLSCVFRKPICTVFYYHMVSDQDVIHVKHLYKYKNVAQFRADLDHLATKYRPIDMGDLLGWLNGRLALPKNSLLLTFDDGFREMYDVVMPILLEKGIAATFFLSSDFIDNKRLCYHQKMSIMAESIGKGVSRGIQMKIVETLAKREIRCTDPIVGVLSVTYDQRDVLDEIGELVALDFGEYLSKHSPYLTTPQVRSMIKKGFKIGAHSIDHPSYATLPLEEQLYQTEESIRIIRETFGLRYGVFAFPHGDNKVSGDFFRRLYKTEIVDASFGTGGILDDEWDRNIQRISLEKPLAPAQQIIAFQLARRMYKLATRQYLIKR